MSTLTNKIALVTGGNSGMGLATAKLFKEQGAKVIITARSNETFQKAQTEYGQVFDVVQTDVSNLAELDRLYAHIKKTYGRLDVVFANAGIGQFAPSTEITPEIFDNLFNTNVRGLYFTVTKALPLLATGSSVILNASTLSGKGMPGASAYSATKAAVRSFARTWTAEVSPAHARFNVLSPGPIETPIYAKVGMTDEHKAGMASTFPAKRFGTSEEMANVALFLASADSSFVNGSEILADGGFGNV